MKQDVARWRGYAMLGTVLGLVIGGLAGYFSPHPQAAAPIAVSTPVPTATPTPSPTPAPLRVHVAGAVRHPDVYTLPTGSIVNDAIDAAGGTLADANLSGINLARELEDQQQVYVPRQGETPIAPLSPSGQREGDETGGRVNINTATLAELDTLPRVGPSTAQRIIDYREANGPFERIEDIQNVSGIGTATFEGLKDLITVGP